MLYAHTKQGADPTQWEPLHDHLSAVRNRTGDFAAMFGAGKLGEACGWWHDLGKASDEFQKKTLGADFDEAASDSLPEESNNHRSTRVGIVDHSTAGARHAVAMLPGPLGYLLAYVIAGHHGRLPNYSGLGRGGTLKDRLDPRSRTIPKLTLTPELLDTIDPSQCIHKSFKPALNSGLHSFQFATLARMLYSALVDADRLETERFCNPERALQRPSHSTTTAQLNQHLDAYLDALKQSRAGNPSPVDQHRATVLAACKTQASQPPGIFTLTVPTGGGKTLASMAFALQHAEQHDQRRVVYALPYTSIIEQTAKTYREVFGEKNVLEYHSNLDQEQVRRRSITTEMAAENFDAPIVVTTNVQLFESLFSAHGSTCRKLHNLTRSVIVLDEAQAIPPRLLRPTLAMLEELTRNYGCTIVLCTATQPAITRREDFPIGLEQVTEIVPEPIKLYRDMQRVRVQHIGLLDDEALAQCLSQLDQVLCIVNTRKHAAQLTALLQPYGTVVHLSALMCPQHRSERVAEIKQALEDKKPIRVISTQVIEAGVDVDFPVVYRALAGFDSIAQAAGRCNREGKAKQGDVFVFETGHKPARSMIAQINAAGELLESHPDPLSLDAIEAYFRMVYWKRKHEGEKPWDVHDVMGCFEGRFHHQFRDAEARFNWIDSQTTNIIVPYGDRGRAIVDHLRNTDEPDWSLLRSAQRYSVSVYENQLAELLANTTVTNDLHESFNGRFWVLNNPEAYDKILGLRMDVSGMGDGLLVV